MSFKLIPLNQHYLELAKQGDKSLAGPDEFDTQRNLQIYVYSFDKMKEKVLKVLPTCTRRYFGLKIELDSLYGRVYVLDVKTKSSATKLSSSIKTTQKAIRLSYIVETASHHICSKSGSTTAALTKK